MQVEAPRKRTHKIEVDSDVQGRLVLLRERRTCDLLGIVHESATKLVTALANNYHTTLSASIQNQNTVAIIVYGQRCYADAVSDFLSQNDWFLQQPDDYDPSTEYRNPRWLLRPGTEFEVLHEKPAEN